jgi:hypothetical protein
MCNPKLRERREFVPVTKLRLKSAARSVVAILTSLVAFSPFLRAQKCEGVWTPKKTIDPITEKKSFGVELCTNADPLPAPAHFEVEATCDGDGFSIKTIYLSLPNPGFMNARRNGLLIVRMRIDNTVRSARSWPLENDNIAIFIFGPKQTDSTMRQIGEITDLLSAPLPGTPSELINAKSIKMEIPLADATKPILQFSPQDPEFQKFASTCMSTFPDLGARTISSTPLPTTRAQNAPNQAIRPIPTPVPESTNPIATNPAAPLSVPTPVPSDRPPGPPTNSIPAGLAGLTIHSGFPTQSNPLSRIPFYVMRDDFPTTMRNAGVKVSANTSPRETFAKVCAKPGKKFECDALFNASKANPAAIAIAGPNGETTFKPLPPGDYYLLIYSYGPGRPQVYWNEKLELKPGVNSFTAGMDNAKPLR